jgi:hypothetical protein
MTEKKDKVRLQCWDKVLFYLDSKHAGLAMLQLPGMTHGRAHARQHQAPSDERPMAMTESVSHVRLFLWLEL